MTRATGPSLKPPGPQKLPEPGGPEGASQPPTIVVVLPSCRVPTPPQCWLMSPWRNAGFPSIKTVALPWTAVHMLGPQQAMCTP